MILTDTNILLRALYPGHPHYTLAKRALLTLRHRAGRWHPKLVDDVDINYELRVLIGG